MCAWRRSTARSRPACSRWRPATSCRCAPTTTQPRAVSSRITTRRSSERSGYRWPDFRPRTTSSDVRMSHVDDMLGPAYQDCRQCELDTGQSPLLARPAAPLAACIQRPPCTDCYSYRTLNINCVIVCATRGYVNAANLWGSGSYYIHRSTVKYTKLKRFMLKYLFFFYFSWSLDSNVP